jgi:hypothetical protein
MGRRIITRPTFIRAGREGTHQKGGDPCATYTSGSSIPQGFGVPWDVANPSSLLLRAECAPPSVTLSLGDNSTLTYIYKTAYVAPNGATSWTPLDLFGAGLIGGAWFPGSAQGIVSIPDTTTASFYVGYTCKWIPPGAGQAGSGQTGVWKCGCRDSACSQSYWQLQKVQR